MPRWLLVEVHGPWGSDAIADSELGPHAPRIWRRALQQRGVRIVAIRRDLDRHHQHPSPGLRLVHVRVARPGATPSIHRTEIDALHHVVAATEWLVDGDPPPSDWAPDPDHYDLVCTNGRHDPCCAVEGRPIVRHLRQAGWGEHLWECSHIGGDRFAGNVVLLPEGLYFGRCSPDDAARVLAARAAGDLDLANLRGRCTLSLPEQAAELHVRQTLGLTRLDAVLDVSARDGGLVDVTVQPVEGPVETVTVDIAREVVATPDPLTCKGSPDQTYGRYTAVTVRARAR